MCINDIRIDLRASMLASLSLVRKKCVFAKQSGAFGSVRFFEEKGTDG